MHCPKCGDWLREVEYESVRINTCDSCGGEVIRPSALRAIVHRREMQFPEPLKLALADCAPSFGPPRSTAAPSLSCPACRRAMQPINYGGDTDIVLDRCTGCGAMFLDHEELEKIQILMERWEDDAPHQIKVIAGEMERARRETAESTSRAFAGSRFAFVNAVLNRLLNAA